jgi:predicted PurR-regulated permease PerM
LPFSSSDGPIGLSRTGQLVARVGITAWSVIGVAVVLYGLYKVAAFLRVLLLIIGVAVLIVLILEPAVSRLQRIRIPRLAGAAISYLSVLAPLSLALWWLGGVLAVQVQELVDQGPALVAQAGGFVDGLWDEAGERGVPLPAETPEAWVEDNRESIVSWATDVATAATQFAGLLLAALAGPVVAFYMLVELPRIRNSFVNLIPVSRREDVMEGMRIIGSTVGAFFRGQLLIAVLVGIMSTVGLLILRVPFAVLVGTIAGLTNLVPFLGPIVGSVFGIALGIIDGGIWTGVWVLVMFVIVQQVESQILSPLIIGASVRLRPVAVIIGMLAGAVVAGLLGMILVIPILASLRALLERFRPQATPEPAESG